MNSLRKQVTTRMAELKRERSHYIGEWREMSDYVIGSRGRFLLSKGQKLEDRRNDMLYNEEAKFANNTLASGLMAGVTSPARPWFKLAIADRDMMEYKPVKEWLSTVETILLTIFSRSNFYNTVHTQYKELGAFGQAPFGIYSDFKNVIRCEPYTIGSYCLANNGRREVDTFYREYQLNVKQLVSRFGLENVSRTVRNQYDKGNYETMIDVLHAIEPNDDRQYDSPLAKDMEFRSVYFEASQTGEQHLALSGFRSNPIMSPRWETVGDDVYASSYPAIDSIGTNKSLQLEEYDKQVAIEKMHNPPMIADAQMGHDEIDLLAGGVSFVNGLATGATGGLRSAYDVQLRIGDLKEDIAMKENRIQRAFYADLFMMISEMDRANITATEIAERKEEKLLMLGPVLERLNHEQLDPTIDRTFNIAQEAGIIPPPPPELSEMGGSLQVEYISLLAQAQKAVSTTSIEATAAFAMNLAQADPSVMDKIHTHQMVDEYARAKGAPVNTVRSDGDVEKIAQQRAEEAAQQQQAMMAAAAVDTAKTLSETDTSGDNALTQLAGASA